MDNLQSSKRSSYCLVQLKNSETKDIRTACREIAGIEGVVAAGEITGIFDILARIHSDEKGTLHAISEIRSKEMVEFATPFESGIIYLSGISAMQVAAEPEKIIE